MAWYHRVRNVLRAGHHSRELDREIAFHVEARAEELRAAGMTADDALREAERRFGNRTVQKERTHDADVVAWLESLLADVRYAARRLAASPGVALVAILSLALGIGANTAIFSLTNALILRPLPVQHPEELLAVTMHGPAPVVLTNPIWEEIRDRVTAFSGAAAYDVNPTFNLAQGGEARMAPGSWVSGDFFSLLGVRAEAGRLLQRSDDVRGCAGVAVVSHGFARREYGAASSAVGRTLSLDGRPFEIVGVVDASFTGMTVGRRSDIYAPLCAEELIDGKGVLDRRSRWALYVIGRPRAGLTPEQVGSALAASAPAIYRATLPAQWSHDDQQGYLKRTLGVTPAGAGVSQLRSEYGKALIVLLVVVGAVLLIACANIANLMLARGAARQHEIAIRMAIGAGRARLLRQLLTESLLLATLGAVLGVAFAHWAARLLVGLLATPQNFLWLDLTIDARVLAFTAAVAVGSALLFGCIPAWRATRIDPHRAMQAGGRGVQGERRTVLRSSLLVGQMALSLALVATSGLLLGSFRKLVRIDPGFQKEGVLLISANFARARDGLPQQLAAERELLERLRAMPSVRAAAASFRTPVGQTAWNDLVFTEGQTRKTARGKLVWFNGVSDDYFRTLGTPLLAGRDITPADGPSSPRVAVIDETMARTVFGTANPIGRTFHTPIGDSAGAPITVVGVVRSAKYNSLTEKSTGTAYVALVQSDMADAAVSYEVRTDGAPERLIPSITAATAQLSPSITLAFTTLDDQISASIARPRLLALLSGFFGALALLLAVIGLYGTMSYAVTQRQTEIGVRIALGAAASRVLRMVVGDAGRLVAAGIVAGVIVALATTRFVSTFLYGMEPTDPAVLAGAALVLAAVTLVAATIPAWRAARVDPMAALREE
ncbi:MAG TPA: ABC transporter permease [Gemmatimonadaceae bacterium]|nr:ABC transporter permease [Gemmatimonadaceae bacterium]